MNIGAIFVGLAAASLLVFYITEPFRRKVQDVDTLIEKWVASISDLPEQAPRSEFIPTEEVPIPNKEASQVKIESGAKFCHHCGDPIKPHHRFCPNCGTKLID